MCDGWSAMTATSPTPRGRSVLLDTRQAAPGAAPSTASPPSASSMSTSPPQATALAQSATPPPSPGTAPPQATPKPTPPRRGTPPPQPQPTPPRDTAPPDTKPAGASTPARVLVGLFGGAHFVAVIAAVPLAWGCGL